MNNTKRVIILVIVGVVFILIGGALQDATGSKAMFPMAMIPVAILWLYLFPRGKK